MNLVLNRRSRLAKRPSCLRSELRTVYSLSLFMALCACIGCGSPSQGADGGDSASASHTISVYTVARQDMPLVVEVPATIEGYEMTNIVSKISGYVSEVQVDIGLEVKKGQVLLKLDVPEVAAMVVSRRRMHLQAKSDMAEKQHGVTKAQAALAEQQAVVDWRKKELTRISALVKSGALKADRQDESEYALKAAQAGVARANAEMAMARKIVDTAKDRVSVAESERDRAIAEARYQVLRAPFDGLVTMRNVDPGALVRPADAGGKMLLSLEHVDRVRLVMFLPMTDAAHLDAGDELTMQNFRTSRTSGTHKLARFAKALHRGSRMMRAEADLTNAKAADGKRPYVTGDYGTVKLTMHVHKAIVALPESAIAQDDSGTDYVMIVDSGGKCRKTPVSIEVRHNNLVGVKGKLKKLEEVGRHIIAADIKSYRDEQSVSGSDLKAIP